MPYQLARPITAIRNTSTPLVAITTADLSATTRYINDVVTEAEQHPVLQWDMCKGYMGVNDAGASVVKGINKACTNPAEMLHSAVNLPERAVVIAHNLHFMMKTPGVVQGIANLRDEFKQDGRTFIMLSSDWKLPAELTHDVVLLEEPLPKAEALREIIKQEFTNMKRRHPEMPDPDDDILNRAVDATRGLSAFSAEQEVAMSLTPAGIDIASLWNRKRTVIKQIPGLSCWQGEETFTDVGGSNRIKHFLKRILEGRDEPRVIVWIDEITDAMAGARGDLSGVSQDVQGTLLSHMADTNAEGVLLVGHAGTGKSLIAKAMGAEAGIPTICMDIGGMFGGIVGETQQKIRAGLRVIDAVSEGRAFYVATCNDAEPLKPQLRRRFTMGTFFFDLPSQEEKAMIWQIFMQRYGIENFEMPDDDQWTGNDIHNCIRLAWKLNISPKEAATYLAPIAVSAPDEIIALQEQANGRYLSAAYEGLYSKPDKRKSRTGSLTGESVKGRARYTE